MGKKWAKMGKKWAKPMKIPQESVLGPWKINPRSRWIPGDPRGSRGDLSVRGPGDPAGIVASPVLALLPQERDLGKGSSGIWRIQVGSAGSRRDLEGPGRIWRSQEFGGSWWSLEYPREIWGIQEGSAGSRRVLEDPGGVWKVLVGSAGSRWDLEDPGWFWRIQVGSAESKRDLEDPGGL